MLKLLIDTCVWLDLAKDHRQQITLRQLEALSYGEQIKLVVPQQVVEEFARNRERIVRESQQSLSSVFRRVKDTIRRFGDEGHREETIAQLDELDHKVATLSAVVSDNIDQIQDLFSQADRPEHSDAAKLRALDRAVHKRAPFHHNKNSVGDALILEAFVDAKASLGPVDSIIFITHNTRDFSLITGDNRTPHPDLADLFDGQRASYSISLSDVLDRFDPGMFEDDSFEDQFITEFRSLPEILAEERRLELQVWHNRHMVLRERVEDGTERIVAREEWERSEDRSNLTIDEIWEGALRSAERAREELQGDVGPWDDFDWGMVNGKLSAIRWILGYEWDMLDT